MKKNSNGFTLVELITILAIVGVIATIVAVSVIGLINDNIEKSYQLQLDYIEAAAKNYMAKEYLFNMPEGSEYVDITLLTLVEGGYITGEIINPKTDLEFHMSLVIRVSYNDGYVYEVMD